MKKKKNVTYSKSDFDIKNLYLTKYDYLFRDVIKTRGECYYFTNKVTNFHNEGNKIYAVVNGTKKYNVSVEYLNDDKIDVKCDCEYHKSTELYCKHVYALILNLKMIYEKEKMIKIYKRNIKKIKNICDEIKVLVVDNKKYLDVLIYSWGLNIPNFYNKYIEQMNGKLDKNNDFKLTSLVHDSYMYLNTIIDDYNKIIDYIIEGKEILKKRKEQKTTVVTREIVYDDSKLFENLDEFFANVDISILEKVREDDIKNGEDTEIMDKAIAKRKERDKQIEMQKKNIRKQYKNIFFFELLSSLFGKNNSKSKSNSDTSYLMPWEEDLVNNNEYDTFNFEEEELEDDDFYGEDID